MQFFSAKEEKNRLSHQLEGLEFTWTKAFLMLIVVNVNSSWNCVTPERSRLGLLSHKRAVLQIRTMVWTNSLDGIKPLANSLQIL